jgi:hypothetical protein
MEMTICTIAELAELEFQADPAATKENFPEFEEELKLFCWAVRTAFGIHGKTKEELITKMRPELGDDLVMRLADQMDDEAEMAENLVGLLRQAKYRLMVALANDVTKKH